MKVVSKLVLVLSLVGLPASAVSAAAPEDLYLKGFQRSPGVPEPIKVVAPEVANVPPGAAATISFVVNVAGVPQSITVSSANHDGLAAAAVEAVRHWRFTPVVRDGVSVETKVLLPVRVTGEPWGSDRLALK